MKWTDEQIIDKYIKLCEKLNKTAGFRDIEKASKLGEICSIRTIYKHFDSLVNLQTMLNYDLNPGTRESVYTEEFLLNIFSKAYIEYGRRLTKIEIIRNLKLTGISKFYKILNVHSINELWEVVERYLKDNNQ